MLSSAPHRDPNTSKWAVTREEWPGEAYPEYCAGWAYVTTPATVTRVLDQSIRMSYFWIDDIHVTGAVREAVEEDDLVSMNATNLTDTEASQRTLENMMSTVQRSNTDLEDLQLKLETIVTGAASQTELENPSDSHPFDNPELKSSEFVGIEAGRLEVERSRLEA